MKKTALALAFIFFCALLLRLGAVWFVERQVAQRNASTGESFFILFPDSENMLATARNLAAGRGHVDEAGRYAWRTPLYQCFLASLLSCGVDSPFALRSANALWGALNCLLIFYAGKRLYGGKAGLVAAGLAAVYPFFVYFSALLLSEQMSVTAVLICLLTLLRLAERPGAGNALLAGVAQGGAVMVKSSLAGYAPFCAVILLLIFWRKAEARRGCGLIALFLCGWLAALAPWAIRNECRLHAFVPVSTMGGFTLYESNSERADAGPNNGKIIFPEGSDQLGEVERDRVLKAAALDWMRDNPAKVVGFGLQKFLRTWNPLPNYDKAQSWYFLLASGAFCLPAMLLAAFGAWRGRAEAATWLVLSAPIYIAMLHSLFMGSVRYREVAMGCVLILAARGVAEVARKLGCDKSWGLGAD